MFIRKRDCSGAALRNEWGEGIGGLLISRESLTFSLCPPTILGGSEAGCKTLAGLWPRWLIVCFGLVGVSLAPGSCQEFNFMQMEVGRKCYDAGTCKPGQSASRRVNLEKLLESSNLDF